MIPEYINYNETLIVSQLQLSEQPVDAPLMLGNRAQSFYVNVLVQSQLTLKSNQLPA